MLIHILEFSPPMTGFETFFNTFRLGIAWSKRLAPGMKVLLVDKKNHTAFGIAEVINIKTGKLGELAPIHAYMNHNQLHTSRAEAPRRLIEGSIKRYGPHKCNENKLFTVIYLKRIVSEQEELAYLNDYHETS